MGLKKEEKDFDSLHVTVTQLPAMRSLAILPRLGKALAPAFAKLDSKTLGKNVEDMDVAAVMPALAALFASIEAVEAQSLIRDLNASTVVLADGRMTTLSSDEAINGVFGGDVGLLLKVTLFALEVNYGDFFAGRNTALPILKAQ